MVAGEFYGWMFYPADETEAYCSIHQTAYGYQKRLAKFK